MDNLASYYETVTAITDYKELAPGMIEEFSMTFPWLLEETETVVLDLLFESQEGYTEVRKIGPVRLQAVPVEPPSPDTIILQEMALRTFLYSKIYEMKEVPVKEERIFLVSGQEGIRITGPAISSGPEIEIESIFYTADEEIHKYGNEDYMVRVNPHLTYYVAIDDLSFELAHVELTKGAETIKSDFGFLATPQAAGTARVKVFAIVNGKAVASSGLLEIEVGLNRKSGVMVQEFTLIPETVTLGLPSEVVIDFYTLWLIDRDYREAERLLAPETLEEVKAQGGLKEAAWWNKYQEVEIAVLKETIEDTRTIVAAVLCLDGEIERFPISLHKLTGQWKITTLGSYEVGQTRLKGGYY